MLNDHYPHLIETKFIWPTIIIVVGLSMLYKLFFRKSTPTLEQAEWSDEDYFESNSVFSGVSKRVVSKSFKGAKISSVFGGNDVNLMQAELQGTAIIDASAVFGGIKLIIPADWTIKSEINSVFGGVEDNRMFARKDEHDTSKTLILKGSCVFGGIEIVGYE